MKLHGFGLRRSKMGAALSLGDCMIGGRTFIVGYEKHGSSIDYALTPEEEISRSIAMFNGAGGLERELLMQ